MDILIHPPKPALLPMDDMSQHLSELLKATPVELLLRLLALLLPILTLIYIHADYKEFLSLGPGGTPATPLGYLKIKLLSIVSLRDPLRPIAIPPHFRPQRGYLSPQDLPPRIGKRPEIKGIAPQRQQTDKSSQEIYAKFVLRLKSLTKDPENMLIERTSCFEKHSSGLFSSAPITRTCGGEVCHVHPSDGGMHLTLHPADAKIMIESGRGERHPLAKGGWFRRFVPKEFVTVYAPRDEEEIEYVMKIVAASVWWVSGLDVLATESGVSRGERMTGEALGKAREENECWACKMKCGQTKKSPMMGKGKMIPGA